MNQDNEIVGKLSLDLDIPTFLVKEALDIPLQPCLAKTVKEARKIFNQALWDPDDQNTALEEQQSALIRWAELSYQAITQASTCREIEKAYYDTPADHAVEVEALLKWLDLAKDDFGEITKIYSESHNKLGVKTLVVTVLISCFTKRIETATNILEIKSIISDIRRFLPKTDERNVASTSDISEKVFVDLEKLAILKAYELAK